MSTTTDERGIINNFAKEPTMYRAAGPSPSEQRRYIFTGAIATIFISAIVFVSFAVS